MKLNLGCWKREIPGFINVDLCDLPHIHIKSDISSLPMIDTDAVDLVYCSHALEYFDLLNAERALKEWFRILKPGGTLRLSVPDFAQLVKIYTSTGKLETILGPIYGRMRFEGNESEPAFEVWHKMLYDERTLTSLLERSGFTDVRHWDWRLTEHAGVDDHSQAYYPHMDKENGIQVSLNLEASKPH